MSTIFWEKKNGKYTYGYAVGRKRKSGFPTPRTAAVAGIEQAKISDPRAVDLFAGKSEDQIIRMLYGADIWQQYFAGEPGNG